ncbi:hypothetical protein ACJA3J_03660 [Halobacillus sp. SY10]|uniref:hypothetical protein n=1 Tax=Halobacillus sp. SY10 TaxID=3381356 RepID=UPI00387A246E
MKWSIYQIFVFIGMALIMWILESTLLGHIGVEITRGEGAVYSPLITFLVLILFITCFYILFLFEAKKGHKFQQSIWTYMPSICMFIGGTSIVLFLLGGTIGPIGGWIEQVRSLFYVFLSYFLFLIFLFIFSFEHKRKRFEQSPERTVHLSYFWTLVLFFSLFFLF